MKMRPAILIFCLAMLAACAKEPPPRTVHEFVDNPLLLEAALVRCHRDRAGTKYDAECVNAREANKQIAAREEAERRAELEARSERKRQALRRTQEAAAEARRRAAEAHRLQEEAEYLAQFGELPPSDSTGNGSLATGNAPLAVVPESVEPQESAPNGGDMLPATDGGNAPVVQQSEEPVSDLEAAREELRRRNEESGD